jgi:Fe-S-cluster containining protein
MYSTLEVRLTAPKQVFPPASQAFDCKRCGNCCIVYYLLDFAKPDDWARIYSALHDAGETVLKVVSGTRGVVEYYELTTPEVDLAEDAPLYVALDGAAHCPFLTLNMDTCEYACGIQEIKPAACRAFDNPYNCEDIQADFGKHILPNTCEDCLDFLGEDEAAVWDDARQMWRPPCERKGANDGEAYECPYGHHELRITYETRWQRDHPSNFDAAQLVRDASKWF